jgi:hypothetical protein
MEVGRNYVTEEFSINFDWKIPPEGPIKTLHHTFSSCLLTEKSESYPDSTLSKPSGQSYDQVLVLHMKLVTKGEMSLCYLAGE